jgi:hypothetical protein
MKDSAVVLNEFHPVIFFYVPITPLVLTSTAEYDNAILAGLD